MARIARIAAEGVPYHITQRGNARRIQEILREQCQTKVAYETLRKFVQRRHRPRTTEQEPEPVATAAPLSDAAKPHWNFDTDGPRTINAATEEKRPRLSPEGTHRPSRVHSLVE